MKRHLQEMEQVVSEAESGAIAGESLQKSRPNMIIAQISKPNMDGLENLNYVKNDPKTKLIPVII
ncbi:MAG: response regulator [SAR324 cluster bacterium]|nr:response regulator [SAR324 cluster bacterium]MCZ6629148.1 response regulator [SAR324 cluster bacterium]MCZ6843795.1 response regulator [SAR324 cluster bacterium]